MIAKEFNRGYLCVWVFFVQRLFAVFLDKLKLADFKLNTLNLMVFNCFISNGSQRG
jgi:hypothetical protein